ncbi:MAG: PIN domain-containing protein [Opitutales bacterium]|nr:PIN domain-containing protein [Opitutales bacterium]
MKVLLDTNVILDVWLAREPFCRDSALLVGKVEKKEIQAVIAPHTITTLHYLGKKVLGEDRTRKLLSLLLDICKVGNSSEKTFKMALKSNLSDFEDAVIEAVSVASKVDFIATRNIKDFRQSQLKALEPSEIIGRESDD